MKKLFLAIALTVLAVATSCKKEDTPTVVPKGALSGVFSVSPTTKVRFSKGNLYCNTTTSPVTYSFEDNQYDYRWHAVGTTYAVVIGGTSTTTPSGTVGAFFWVKNSETAINPYDATYGTPNPGNSSSDILFTNADNTTPKSDFTVNGSTGVWRTLSGGSSGEWNWLLGPFTSPDPGTNCRTSSTVGGTSNARYAKIKLSVNSLEIGGLLIFPDVFTWDATTMGTTPTNCNNKSVQWTDVPIYTKANFTAMESAGCVFLPLNDNKSGNYWSSTAKDKDLVYFLSIDKYTMRPGFDDPREFSKFVRLVTAAQ